MQMKQKSKLDVLSKTLELFSRLFQTVYTKSYNYGYNRQIKKNKAKAVMAVKDIPLFGECKNCNNNPNMDSFNPSICFKCTEYRTMIVLQDKVKYCKSTIGLQTVK